MATTQKLNTLGIELGSTRIKAVLTSFDGTILASGMHDWENRFEDGYWTYHLDDVWAGIRDAYRDLALNYENTYGEVLQTVGMAIFHLIVMDNSCQQSVPGVTLQLNRQQML